METCNGCGRSCSSLALLDGRCQECDPQLTFRVFSDLRDRNRAEKERELLTELKLRRRHGELQLAIEFDRAFLRGLGVTWSRCSCGLPVIYVILPRACVRFGVHVEKD